MVWVRKREAGDMYTEVVKKKAVERKAGGVEPCSGPKLSAGC